MHPVFYSTSAVTHIGVK